MTSVDSGAGASTSGEQSSTPPKLRCLNIVNVVAYLINVVVTYGIGVGGILDLPTNDELSQKYQTLVTPIGWAFSIWGIIFGLQALWVIVPLVVKKQRDNPFIYAIGYYYLCVCIAQAAWTVAFSLEVIWAALIFMITIAFFLWRIVWCVADLNSAYKGTLSNYLLWRLPFTIHAGWITAAAFVNVNVLLVDLSFGSGLQYAAALGSLFCIFIVGSISTISLDVIIPLVLSWALFGVFTELLDPLETIEETFNEHQIEMSRWGSLFAALLLAVGAVVGFLHQCTQKRHQPSPEASDDATATSYHQVDL